MHQKYSVSNFLSAFYGLMLIFSVSAPAFAQQCDAPYESVTRLYSPNPGSYTVWNSVYGEPHKGEGFSSIFAIGKDIIAVGEMLALNGVTPSLMMVRFDHRGRKVWNSYQSISGFQNVVKAHATDKGFMVLVNTKKVQKRAALWLGFFDMEGKLKSHKIIDDKNFDLHANDIQPSGVDGGWVVAVRASFEMGAGKEQKIRKNASLYVLDKDGGEKSSRSYILGTNNEISSLGVSKLGDETAPLIATGYFENDYGKKVGWVMRLDKQGALVWQREFSRGDSANFTVSDMDENGHIYVAGNIIPSGGDMVGGGVLKLGGESGEIIWQRYYYARQLHHDFDARGLYVNKDGLVTLMLMARAHDRDVADEDVSTEDDEVDALESMDYTHVLTLTPRGITIDGDAYYYGLGAKLKQLVEGEDGSRIMAGVAKVPPGELFAEKAAREKGIEAPLTEEGHIDLPEGTISEQTKKGLAMLQNKIKAQGHENSENVVKQKDVKTESAKVDVDSYDGWVVIGDKPDAYNDPCE